MTAKTSGEIEKEFIDNLKASTKKDLDGWLAEISSLGITKRNDIINSLKNDYGFGHMNASLLAGIYLNGGKPVYGSTDDLLENQFAKAEAMREIYESCHRFCEEEFSRGNSFTKEDLRLDSGKARVCGYQYQTERIANRV